MPDDSAGNGVTDLTGLGKLADSKFVARLYDDALAAPARELGATAADIVKTFRLFLAPFQLAAAVQVRFRRWLDRVRAAVPIERQIEAAPSIAGPVLRDMVFVEADGVISEMFLNLLARAIDKERKHEAHPAFANIIRQLSPDEAIVLANMREHGFLAVTTTVSPRVLPSSTVTGYPTDELIHPERWTPYAEHLESLCILQRVKDEADYGTLEEGVVLTEFGKLFVTACLPKSEATDSR